jgi:hypothetical protein
VTTPRVLELSVLTPAYSSTPAPLGRPGGPGLWRDKSRKLPDYIENVARGIMQGGVADKSRAIATAIAAVKRWAAGGGKVSPEVRAAAAKAIAEWEALKASAHAHANESGGAVSLTWNGQAVDLATVDLGYMPPHVPAGSPAGGQFGTTSSGKGTNSGGTAGKTAAQQHALHLAHIAHLQHLVATGKATPAQRRELAGLLKALSAPKGKPGAGTAAAREAAAAAAIAAHPLPDAAKKKAAAKPKAKAKAPAKAKVSTPKKAAAPKAPAKPKATPKAPAKPGVPARPKVTAKPVVDRKKGTVTATIGGKRVTMTLAQWHARHVAHLEHVAHLKAMRAKGLASDGGRFLDLAVADAITVPGPEVRRLIAPADRVPPGVREGGQFTPRPPQFTRHDTPERAAEVINAMGPRQRAAVRATILVPPGFEWRANDLLAEAELDRLALPAVIE